MPEFILNTASRSRACDDLSAFARGYIEAMFFTNGDTGDDKRENHLNDLGVVRLTRQSIRRIADDCEAFLSLIAPAGTGAPVRTVRDMLDACPGTDDMRAGRDLWLTRQHHGVGFWEGESRGYPGGTGDALTACAHMMGEASVCVSRGWIHHD